MLTMPRQVDPDELIQTLHDHPNAPHKRGAHTQRAVNHTTPYSTRYNAQV